MMQLQSVTAFVNFSKVTFVTLHGQAFYMFRKMF